MSPLRFRPVAAGRALSAGLSTVVGVLVTTLSVAAQASAITSPGDSLLTGASVITFSEVGIGTLDPTVNGVSFTGVDATLVTLDASLYGQASPILGNSAEPPFYSAFGVPFDIVFATAVSAFSLDLAAINGANTSMSAYDAADVLLGTIALPPNSDLGTLSTWGLGDSSWSISRVRIETDDFFFTDNLRYVGAAEAVPEPATLALAAIALLGVGTTSRRRRGT